MAESGLRFSKRLRNFPPSVWITITEMVQKHNAVNLGKGFPDWPSPDFIKAAGSRAILEDHNQYTRSKAHPRLARALSREIDADTEVLVTVGAAEALCLSMLALLDEGDEAIVIEPFFDFYPQQIKLAAKPLTSPAGATPVFVPLRYKEEEDADGVGSSSQFYLDMGELENAVTDKTRMIIVNTPHNPTGKVFAREELEAIAALSKKHNLVVVSDEVYEWMVYDEVVHTRMASLDGMWERTITIGSGGKTFSVTGWKVGWVLANPFLVDLLWKVHQSVAFCLSTPLQEAVAESFEHAKQSDYFQEYRMDLMRRRNVLVEAVKAAGLKGSYFLFVNTKALQVPELDADEAEAGRSSTALTRDFRACYHLIRKYQLATIPPAAFYSPEHKHLAERWLRFCFCKTDGVLHAASDKLKMIGEG